MNVSNHAWLLLITNLPGQNQTLRMRIWRALKAAGAGLLRDGVYVLLQTPASRKLFEEQAFEIGIQAYIFGYPLVTLEMTRRVMTNTVDMVGMRSPMGQFAHARQFPPVNYRDVPGANADTLYSTAWLDLATEPYILLDPGMSTD